MSEDAGSVKFVGSSPTRYAGPPAVVVSGAVILILVIILDVSALELLKLVNSLLKKRTGLKVFIFLPILVMFFFILVSVIFIITGLNFVVTLLSGNCDKVSVSFILLAISCGFIRGQTYYPNLKQKISATKLINRQTNRNTFGLKLTSLLSFKIAISLASVLGL